MRGQAGKREEGCGEESRAFMGLREIPLEGEVQAPGILGFHLGVFLWFRTPKWNSGELGFCRSSSLQGCSEQEGNSQGWVLWDS